MGPAALRHRLRLLLPASALLLLLHAAAVRGDCGLPPVIPHAQAELGGNTNFPENASVLYRCEKDFYKIPGMADAVICLPNNKWTDIKEFCNRSCEVPPRFTYAALKKIYISKNFFPVGTVIDYECRPGYKKKPGLPTKVTCLDNVTWSTPETFCDKRSCPIPGEILNGYVEVKTDLLFGSQIFFSCETGYRLAGAASAFCLLSGNGVEWSEQLPLCTKILCPDPPTITNGWITNERHIYEYRQVVTYQCERGFTLTGDKQISCTVRDDTGEWSGSAPTCIAKSSRPLTSSPRPSTTNTPGTEVSLPPQKHTTVNVPGMEVPSTSQKSATVNDAGTEVPTAQKSTTVNVPTTVQPTPQKPTTVNVPTTRDQPIPQKSTPANIPATRIRPTLQKHTTIQEHHNTGVHLIPQKHTTVNIAATEVQSPHQKLTTVNVPDAEVSPMPQKTITINISDTEAPLTTQKPTTANSSATKAPAAAQTSPIPHVLSTVTTLATQSPTMGNASATQTTPATQTSSTAKALFTQTLPTRQKSTPKRVSVTQRFTSAHITASGPGSTSSPTTASEEKGLTSGYKGVLYGVVPAVIIIGSLILAKFLWDRGKSGYYKTRENNKASNVLFHNLNETDAAPEIRLPSDKL